MFRPCISDRRSFRICRFDDRRIHRLRHCRWAGCASGARIESVRPRARQPCRCRFLQCCPCDSRRLTGTATAGTRRSISGRGVDRMRGLAPRALQCPGGSEGKRYFLGPPVPGAAAAIAGIMFGYRCLSLDAPRALSVTMAVAMPVLAALIGFSPALPCHQGFGRAFVALSPGSGHCGRSGGPAPRCTASDRVHRRCRLLAIGPGDESDRQGC